MEEEYRKQISWMLEALDEDMLRKVYSYVRAKLEIQEERKRISE